MVAPYLAVGLGQQIVQVSESWVKKILHGGMKVSNPGEGARLRAGG